jgi:hypothetical protein
MKKAILFLFICGISYTGLTAMDCPCIPQGDSLQFLALIEAWNRAHGLKEAAALNDLYADRVQYYGSPYSREACIKSKQQLFKRYAEYRQEVFGAVRFDTIGEGTVKCSFVKRVFYDHKTDDYPSYLIFQAEPDGRWRIGTESDEVTDANLKKKALAAMYPRDAVQGDFNGDGQTDFVWLVAPKINEEEMTCIGECVAYLKFSDPALAQIRIVDCIGGVPDNLGDLNGDGTDEIGLLPHWFTSCWRSYSVWSWKDGQWRHPVKSFQTHCNQWDQKNNFYVKPDPTKPGYVLVRYSDFSRSGDIVAKTKSVPFR